MRHVPALIAACTAALAATLSHAQVVFTENFDDGAAAARFDVRTINPATPSQNADINFNYNYGAFQYTKYASGTSTPLATPVLTNIPSAPGSTGGSTTGLRFGYTPIDPAVTGGSTIMSLGVLPKAVNVADNFKIEGYMWMNYNGNPGDQFSTQGGAGSTEYMTVGIRRSGDTLTGPFPVGTNSPGYAFTMTGEGGQINDARMHNTDVGDDGPAWQKRTGNWFANVRENRYNLETGELVVAGTALLLDTPDNQAHSYWRNEVFRNDQGFEIAGAPAKKWVKFEVEQHGRIATYMLNGKPIGVLFNSESFNGTPQFGYFDRTNGRPAAGLEPGSTTTRNENQFMLYDNLTATQMAAATANTLGATNYAAFNAGGSYAANGAATLSYLEVASADPVTISGTGTLTLGQTLGAVQSIGNGVHTITKPVLIAADTQISVVGTATVVAVPVTDPVTRPNAPVYGGGTMEITNVTWGANTDFGKEGAGTLRIPNVRANSLYVADGRLQLTGAGPSKASKVTNLDVGYASTTQIDLGRTLLAVDYVPRTSTAVPTLTNSPFVALAARLNSGFRGDTAAPGFAAFDGAGIIVSASEVQGAAFSDPANSYTVRIVEAGSIGYTSLTGQAWGSTGLTIDASTVLIGFSFKADADFDQDVDFDDLLALARNYNPSYDPTGPGGPKQFFQGDSTGNGITDFDDLLALARVYSRTIGAPAAAASAETFAADWALAQAIVPEPTALAAVLGLGGIALKRRRR